MMAGRAASPFNFHAQGVPQAGSLLYCALRGNSAMHESKSVSRILFPDSQILDLSFEIQHLRIGMAIIPLGQTLPIGSSDLPGNAA